MKAKNQKALIIKLPHEYAEDIVTGRAQIALILSCPPLDAPLARSRVLIQDDQTRLFIGEALIVAADLCPVDSAMNGISYAFTYWEETGMTLDQACQYMHETDIPAALRLACPIQYTHAVSAQKLNRSWAFADDITEDFCTIAKKHTPQS